MIEASWPLSTNLKSPCQIALLNCPFSSVANYTLFIYLVFVLSRPSSKHSIPSPEASFVHCSVLDNA